MTSANGTANDEAEIRALVAERVAALAAKDSDALDARLAPDVVLFDALPPLRRTGRDDARAKIAAWLGGYDGPIGYEVRELQVAASGDVAFCHYLGRVSGTMTDGQTVDMWVRVTLCLRQIGGKWLITHEHTSVPFDAMTGQAATDLLP